MKRIRSFLVVLLLIAVLVSPATALMRTRTYTIAVLAADAGPNTVAITDISKPVYLQEVKVTIPNTTNNVTHTFAIVDEASATRYSIAGLVETTSHILFPSRVIGYSYTFSVTPSAATGNNIIITIVATYDE